MDVAVDAYVSLGIGEGVAPKVRRPPFVSGIPFPARKTIQMDPLHLSV
jgi:hypothetical protein